MNYIYNYIYILIYHFVHAHSSFLIFHLDGSAPLRWCAFAPRPGHLPVRLQHADVLVLYTGEPGCTGKEDRSQLPWHKWHRSSLVPVGWWFMDVSRSSRC